MGGRYRLSSYGTTSWGFEVRERQTSSVHGSNIHGYTSLLKPLLLKSEHTESLALHYENLKKMGRIEEPFDIVVQFLEQLCHHTIKQLDFEGFYTTLSDVEVALCIPAFWDEEIRLALQQALSTALTSSGLGTRRN